MGNDLFKKMCGKVDYNTYCKINNTLGNSAIAMLVINSSIQILTHGLYSNQYPLLYWFVSCLMSSLIFSKTKLVESNGIYTKDIQEIRALYKEFIKNYNQLNKTFNLNNPIEIHTMFYYLLNEGYLSHNKEFMHSKENVRDITSILGANVLNGNGVCRHISPMLTDILLDYGIESANLDVYANLEILNMAYFKKALVNEAKNIQLTDEEFKMLLEMIDSLVETIPTPKPLEKKKKQSRKNSGNHVISFAYQDGYGYFLDPTNNQIYLMDKENESKLYNDLCKDITIKMDCVNLFNTKESCEMLRERLKTYVPSISKEEEAMMTTKTLSTCNSNLDIFEQFYHDNSDLYHEVSSKLLNIKVKKKTRFK